MKITEHENYVSLKADGFTLSLKQIDDRTRMRVYREGTLIHEEHLAWGPDLLVHPSEELMEAFRCLRRAVLLGLPNLPQLGEVSQKG